MSSQIRNGWASLVIVRWPETILALTPSWFQVPSNLDLFVNMADCPRASLQMF